MANAKPTLASVHDDLQQVERGLLEVVARVQLIAAPAASLTPAQLTAITQPIVKAVMDLEILMVAAAPTP